MNDLQSRSGLVYALRKKPVSRLREGAERIRQAAPRATLGQVLGRANRFGHATQFDSSLEPGSPPLTFFENLLNEWR